jgi:hypothetical protein
MPRPFLNLVLAFDAATCALMGAGLALAARPLAALLGLPAPFLAAAGAALLGFALLLGWMARRDPVPLSLAALVIAGNLGWSAASLVLAIEGIFPLTPIGTAFVVAQALAVLAIAAAEYAGLRRMRVAAS